MLQKAIIISFFALYLVSCFTPLRLEHDSLRYFAIKDCIESGCPPDSPAANDFLPYGYPVLLAALSKTGLLNSFSIAFINGLFLWCSLVLTRKMMNVTRLLLFYSVVLLNWTFIKLFAYPLSEMQYLFFSTISLYYFYQYTKTKKWYSLLLSFVLAGLAVLTRTIGIALIVALVIGLAWEHRKLFRSQTFRIIIYSAAVILIAVMVFAFSTLPGVAHYLGDLLSQDLPGTILKHVQEWGQLLLNMPVQKMYDFMGPAKVNILLLFAGALFIAWFIYALIRRRKNFPAVIIIYLVIYSLIIFKWPYTDPRFWVPVLPLIIACIVNTPLPLSNSQTKKLFFVFPLYVAIGLVAFGFSFYTQFNKEVFARKQANGIFRKEYEIHFFGKSLTDTTANVNYEVLRLLERYD